MIDSAARLSRVLAQTPFAARLGLLPGDIFTDAATASVPYSAALANAQGFVHGGVAAALSLWSSMVVAVASDRDAAAAAHPVSLSVSYLASAREEALHATARVASRGRDLAHVEIEIASERGRSVAAALAVMRTRSDLPRLGDLAPAAAARAETQTQISPFSRAMGVEVLSVEPASVTMSMPCAGNEGLGGAIDPASLVAMSDTCAALACMPSIDERRRGSATLSLSAVFGPPPAGPVLAIGRNVVEDGAVRSALVTIGPKGGAPASPAAMLACVSYRFLAADPYR